MYYLNGRDDAVSADGGGGELLARDELANHVGGFAGDLVLVVSQKMFQIARIRRDSGIVFPLFGILS